MVELSLGINKSVINMLFSYLLWSLIDEKNKVAMLIQFVILIVEVELYYNNNTIKNGIHSLINKIVTVTTIIYHVGQSNCTMFYSIFRNDTKVADACRLL